MIARRAAFRSLELPHRRCLINAHASRDDVRLVVILSSHRRASKAAQYRDLAHMRERIGYRALE